MEDWEKAYAAGLIDGEGSVGIECHNNRCGRPQANPHVECSNKNHEALRFLQVRFGGNIQHMGSNCYKYVLHGRVLITYLLTNIRPYCIIKRDQITTMLAFFEACPIRQGVRQSDEMQGCMLEFVEQFHELNRKGKEVTSEA